MPSMPPNHRLRLPLLCLLILAAAAGCVSGKTGDSTPQPAAAPGVTAGPGAKPTPRKPVVKYRAASILSESTLFTVYGRAFGRAPILGRLGTYRGFEDMERDIQPWIEGISSRHDKKRVIPALHLIYAMAIPCVPGDDCLLYLEGIEKDIVGTYIEPAARRGWMVILDTQIGKSTPVRQVQRILDKGYLQYDNVAVAIDPEFSAAPDQETPPGRPIGTVKASQINKVQKMLDDHTKAHRLPSKRILIVHQFGDANVDDGVPHMIQNKKSLQTFDNVELVFDADGLGGQAVKMVKYNRMTDAAVYPFTRFRGIKIFFPNQWEKHGHFDTPPMELDQIFGLEPALGGKVRIENKPDVVIIA
ncbi:MAG: hypothetical protein QM330_04145 [Acidobacteriota bacterium]|jgi:hypothetical protein|nr:hypothetical protein [Acidobacteriota bacterium]NLT32753.1 hypothetical protein [Acidobacteriota bacterium]